MSDIKTLDVTQIPPKLKHPSIFKEFDSLGPGEEFIILNDHDPKPLYYQLLGERGNIFNWEYLEEGPQWWKVKIARHRSDKEAETVGDIAAKDLRKAEVFRKFGLDFCCGGKKSLEEACADAGVSVNEVSEALGSLPQQPVSRAENFNSWSLDFLADYIVNIHHRYVTDSIPVLNGLAEKIAQHHGAAHPELYEIRSHVAALLAEMQSHQIKEENILFPFIRQMVQCEREGKPFAYPPFGTIENPVQMMLADHNEAAAHIHAIEALSGNYEVPADGCDSYRLYYYKLHEFDRDLHQHIHLENNILFPKSVQLEKKLTR